MQRKCQESWNTASLDYLLTAKCKVWGSQQRAAECTARGFKGPSVKIVRGGCFEVLITNALKLPLEHASRKLWFRAMVRYIPKFHFATEAIFFPEVCQIQTLLQMKWFHLYPPKLMHGTSLVPRSAWKRGKHGTRDVAKAGCRRSKGSRWFVPEKERVRAASYFTIRLYKNVKAVTRWVSNLSLFNITLGWYSLQK